MCIYICVVPSKENQRSSQTARNTVSMLMMGKMCGKRVMS